MAGRQARSKSAWDAERWRRRFRRASSARDYDALRELRVAVFSTTARAVRDRGYELRDAYVGLDPGGEYKRLHGGTRFHRSTLELTVPARNRERFRTEILVLNQDCLEVAQWLADTGDAPGVLNMANRHVPGGGVVGGAGAQEENLFRRSNLLYSLYQYADFGGEYDVPPSPDGSEYPIPRESGGIYSPSATVFRSSESTGYAFLHAPFRAGFITVPAIARPEVYESDGNLWLTQEMAAATRVKIRAILRIGAHHDHADLVLGAFGCGAFRNPPQHMARLFREVLAEEEFTGVFRRTVFAILDDHNAARGGNFAPFEREL